MVVLKYVVSMLLYFVFLFKLVDFMRRHHKIAHGIWIGSLLTIPLWIMGSVEGWFRWVKNLSVLLPTIFLGFARVASNSLKVSKLFESLRKDWVLKVLYGVLFLNIFEATMKDFMLANYFNAMCGALLCITIPLPKNGWYLSKVNGELIAKTTIGWNFMYTTWNACFVYGEGATFFASSLVILLVAELYPVIKKNHELYIMARVYTLAAHLVIRSSFPSLFPSVMNASTWFNEDVLKIWGSVNIILMVLYGLNQIRRKKINSQRESIKIAN